jgi:hypothetical protein
MSPSTPSDARSQKRQIHGTHAWVRLRSGVVSQVQTRAQKCSLRVPIVFHYRPIYDLLHQQIRIRYGELIASRMISESALFRGRLDRKDHLHGPDPRIPQERNAGLQAFAELLHRFQAPPDSVVQRIPELPGSLSRQRIRLALFYGLFRWLHHRLSLLEPGGWRRQERPHLPNLPK